MTRADFARSVVDGIPAEVPHERVEFFLIDDILIAALMACVSFFVEKYLQEWWDSCHGKAIGWAIALRRHAILTTLREQVEKIDHPAIAGNERMLSYATYRSIVRRVEAIPHEEAVKLATQWRAV